jgi:hypothetical protein
MKIFELLRNPLIKTIGIVLVLYFALFANKEKPESLGNRLSSENIKKSLSEAQSQSKFIITNVKIAQEIAKEKERAEEQALAQQNISDITTNDLEIGAEEQVIACGDEVEIAYGIYTKDGKQLEFFNSQKFIVGEEKNLIIERNIIGMKRGGIREINIPYHYRTEDKKLAELLKLNATDLKYQITLLSIVKGIDSTLICK